MVALNVSSFDAMLGGLVEEPLSGFAKRFVAMSAPERRAAHLRIQVGLESVLCCKRFAEKTANFDFVMIHTHAGVELPLVLSQLSAGLIKYFFAPLHETKEDASVLLTRRLVIPD